MDVSAIRTEYSESVKSLVAALKGVHAELHPKCRDRTAYRFTSFYELKDGNRVIASAMNAVAPPGFIHFEPQALKAQIYQLSRTAANIRAFIAVNRQIKTDLSGHAAEALQCGTLSTGLICLRSLLERVAVAHRLEAILRPLNIEGANDWQATFKSILSCSDQVAAALFGTKVNWGTLANSDFGKLKPADIRYEAKDLQASFAAKQIFST